MAQAKRAAPNRTDSGEDTPVPSIHHAIYQGDFATVRILATSENINLEQANSKLTPLHIAVGVDRPDIVRFLVGKGAKFTPDPQGRMPSMIAIDCLVSDEMCDYIMREEDKALYG